MAELEGGQIKGQMSFLDGIDAELGDPSAKRAFAILELAGELGWTESPFASFTVRLTHPDGLPFYATWHWSLNPETGKRSYRFAGAFAKNGQPLAYADIKTYLQDPSVIFPEPPALAEDDSDEAVAEALGNLAPLNPRPVIPAADWSVLA
jgi:hypothetical protein